jgi:hypothetical protein
MNISKAGGAAVAARSSPPPRAAKPRDEATFAVPKDDASHVDETSEARDEEDVPLTHPMDPSAWMLPPPPSLAAALPAEVDLTDPAAQFGPPNQRELPASVGGAFPPAPPVPSSPEAPPAPAPDAAAAPPAPSPQAAVPSSGASRPRAPSSKPGEPADAPALKPPEAPRVKSAAAPEGPMPDATPSPVTGPSVSWGTPPGEAPPRRDNALTAVNDLTPPAPSEEATAARARLQDAATSSAHQRTLRDVAQGELTLPDLGRVAVRAHLARDAVDVEIRAAQTATAHALHARAESLAADIRAADISVTRLSFEGAGAWVPSQDTPSRGRGEDLPRGPRDGDASPEPSASARVPGARVRIVL